MAGQIIGNCQQEVVHSARESCSVIPGSTRTLLLHPQNATYSLGKDEFIGKLETLISAEPNVDRIIPVGPISGNTPSGGDLVTSAPGNYGGTVTTGINPTTVAYQIDNGDACLYKELVKLNRRTVRVFHVDDAGFIFGTERAGGFAGYLATVYAYEVQATGTERYQLWINLDYSANYENEKMNRHGFMLGTENIPEGLQGLRLEAGEAGKATVRTACGADDVTAVHGSSWTTTTFINSAGARPTTVTFDAETGTLSISPAGQYRVADAKDLAAAGITGAEGVTEYATITTA